VNGTSDYDAWRGIDMVAELKERIKDVASLCHRFHVQELHLFGSSTSASSISEVGDLDFLVRFDDMPPALYSNSYFGLAEGLSELLSCRVDLVEEIAIRNPFFREAVEEAKERIYGVP
jgi:predicted nucleotidyltransferase